MKKLVAGVLVAAVAAMTGCNTSGPGGPGATGTASRMSNYGPAHTNGGLTADTAHHTTPGEAPRANVPAGEAPKGNAPLLGNKNSFRLEGPAGLVSSVTLKQGEKKEIALTVDRGSDFKQSVKLEVMNQPKGLKVHFEKPTVPASDKEAKVMIEADKTAPLGKQEVDINGMPESGPAPEQPLKLTVNVEKGGEGK
jgi:hypothetical protein